MFFGVLKFLYGLYGMDFMVYRYAYGLDIDDVDKYNMYTICMLCILQYTNAHFIHIHRYTNYFTHRDFNPIDVSEALAIWVFVC